MMPRLSDMNSLEEVCMDSFEDVDIDSPDPSTQNKPHVGDEISHRTDSLTNNVGSEASRLVAKKLRVPGETAYQAAFTQFHTNTGTPYPCTQNDLDVHNTGTFQQTNSHPFISAINATREIMLQNHITRRIPPTELAAIETLRKSIYALEKRMDFGPDLAAKVFADLDLVFFGGTLRDNVRVQWARATDDARFAGATAAWGSAQRVPARQGKGLIFLNADVLLRRKNRGDDPLRDILGTLLHEMCHAAEHVRCKRGLAAHDNNLFGTRIAVVHRRAGRVLGLWAVGRKERYRRHHFFPEEEQTPAQEVLGWILDVDDMLANGFEAVGETALREFVDGKSIKSEMTPSNYQDNC